MNEDQKTYEFYFNLSQVYLKDGQTEEALSYLQKAYQKAAKDDSINEDQIRFKV
jgi:Flp pilus assembly protein TadD